MESLSSGRQRPRPRHLFACWALWTPSLRRRPHWDTGVGLGTCSRLQAPAVPRPRGSRRALEAVWELVRLAERRLARPACPVQVPPSLANSTPGAVPEPQLRGGGRPRAPEALSPLRGTCVPGWPLASRRPGRGPCLASPRDRFVQILSVRRDGFPPRAKVPVLAVPSELGPGPRLFASFLWALLHRLLLRNLRLFEVMC